MPASKKKEFKKGFFNDVLGNIIELNNTELAKAIFNTDLVDKDGQVATSSGLKFVGIAAEEANLDLLKFLVEEKKVDLLTSKDGFGATALDRVIISYRSSSKKLSYQPIIEYLLEKDPRLLIINQQKTLLEGKVKLEDYFDLLQYRRKYGITNDNSIVFSPIYMVGYEQPLKK